VTPRESSGSMRIMGIDPGTRSVGYGIVERHGPRLTLVTCGTIRPPSRDKLSVRLKEIFHGLSRVIAYYEPELVAVEDVFAGKGSKSSIKIGEGRGIALLSAGLKEIPVAEYTATRVKLATTGNGHASKQQVQKMVRTILGIADRAIAEDSADALAIAICHCHRSKIPDGA
jgi:crossover junction endodeoxyribonuclease RuvC